MIIVSLFDESGNMVRPWAIDGHQCFCFDLQNNGKVETFPSGGKITFLGGDLSEPAAREVIKNLKPGLIFAFPPCTDLAVSGAKHFASKLAKNPHYLRDAMSLVYLAADIANECGEVPYMIENPVSVISSQWRKPDFIFHPWYFGGYLPVNDVHPRFPDILPPRDAYPKKTCLWVGNGFKMPMAVPVTPQKDNPGWAKLGGKSARTKKIRSETPRGFAIAVQTVNS